MKNWLFLLMFGSIATLTAFPILHSENIAFLTIPKSGTNLLYKTIWLISGKNMGYDCEIEIGGNNVYFNHIWCPIQRLQSGWKKVILIRDPRDSLISMLYWENRDARQGGHIIPSRELGAFHKLSHDEKITHLILFPKTKSGIPYYCNAALKWMTQPDVTIIRFEDLVGEEGGGDRERQLNIVNWLAQLLECPLTDLEVDQISASMFGKEHTATFRKGMIGSWREEFKEHHKQLFKQVMGKELIALGYETDYNW